ncbi:ferrochelatase [Sandaracinus amylolyticus]|uniref:ferrochelatase n=1 Tax=Sandaracinus amylolyticus TaxID=927083 RepID=UPI00069D1CFF|nr:ferrochelatase [Sandaracinus amylolyticus]
MTYDALLVLSFGGPEGDADVMPFLENVTRGRGIPRERLLEVAEHYHHFGGVSPINGQVRALIDALERELRAHGITLPVYWGNRNWHPMLEDTVRRMKDDGVRRALALVTSAFGSYSGCRQYREDIERARASVGEGAPEIEKLRLYFDHPGFADAQIARVRDALGTIDGERARLLFTAHSIPMSMARTSPYEAQLRAMCELVARGVAHDTWELCWQSRSGPPQVPWLEPDVLDVLARLASEDRAQPVVVIPIGFTSDHMEVVWDLDHEAKARAGELGLRLVRAGTVGTHPAFVAAMRELVQEKLAAAPKRALTTLGNDHDPCAASCCPAPQRPSR